MQRTDRFSFFVDLFSDIDIGLTYFDIGLAPGISFNLTDHWSAEFSYGLVCYQWVKDTNQTVTQSLDLGFMTAATGFGIYYNF